MKFFIFVFNFVVCINLLAANSTETSKKSKKLDLLSCSKQMNKNGFPTECECKPALIYDAEVGKCVIKQKTALCTKSLPPQCKCDDKKYAYDEKAKNCIFKPSVEKNVQSDIEEDIFAEDGSEDDLDSPMKPAKETRK